MDDEKNQKLIIFRGPAGTGKSTVAEKLRDIGKDRIWLQVDALKHFFPHHPQKDRPLLYETAKDLAEFFLSKGFSTIADGTFNKTEWVDWFVDLAKRRKIPWKVFEFRAAVEDVIRRDRERPGVKKGWRKPISKRYLKGGIEFFRKNTYPGAIQIDTSEKSVEGVVKFILQETGWKEGIFGKLRRYLFQK